MEIIRVKAIEKAIESVSLDMPEWEEVEHADPYEQGKIDGFDRLWTAIENAIAQYAKEI